VNPYNLGAVLAALAKEALRVLLGMVIAIGLTVGAICSLAYGAESAKRIHDAER
jgi:hypothetical protein